MTWATRSAWARLVLAGATAVTAIAAAVPAGAAGTGGIELTPVAPTAGTAFHVRASPKHPARLAFELRNIGTAAADAHVYAASVARNGTAYAVAGPGSAPWIALPDQVVHLEPGASRHIEVPVDADRAPAGSIIYGAVVQETRGDVAVRPRVATLVYLQRSGASAPPRPVAWLAVASLLLAVMAGAVGSQLRRQASGRRS